MRELARHCGVSLSVAYHHFEDKDNLLRSMFDHLNSELGTARASLPEVKSASEMLRQRILFQIDHAAEIVAVLKYFITYRDTFQKTDGGYVPPKTSLHIEEVLQRGIESGEFKQVDLVKDAKVITHAINGFLLEYYPDTPKGKARLKLADDIHQFLIRALRPV